MNTRKNVNPELLSDEKKRCPGDYQKDPIYLHYHDEEWGRPCHNERELYEMFVIELFQAGLSWRTLLHKRENFEKAYDGFDLNKVADYDEEKIALLMQDAGIIRSLPKIRGSIINSRIIRDEIIPEYGSFDAYVWHFTNGNSIYEPPGVTKDSYSDAMAADLKKRGAKYAGSVSLFSYLQAVGVINSHTKDCFCYEEIFYGNEMLHTRFDFPENIVRVTAGQGGEALLIFGSEKTALVDCGMACFAEPLIRNIHNALQENQKKTGICRTLDYILCTHSHYDHAGALAALKEEWPEAVSCASAYAKKVFSRPGAIATMQEMTRFAGKTFLNRTDFQIDFRYMVVDRVLKEGDRVDLGDSSVLTIETPGHTNCSLSFALEPQRILFLSESTGVLNARGKVESAVLKHYSEAYESMRKCRAYEASRLIVPHTGLIPKAFHEKFWELLAEDLEFLVQFVAVRQDHMTEDQILEEFVRKNYEINRGNTQPLAAFSLNAKYQLRAAAEELERRKEKLF